jgi:hypothetical protein
MNEERVSRRDLLQKTAAFGVLAVVGAGACSKPESKLSCTDTMSLSASDAQLRATLSYVDVSMEPGKSCAGCQQFLPGPANACGACKVLRGPINPTGDCKSFAPKTA